MKRFLSWSIALGIIGGILVFVGGVTKHAYTTGGSYFVTFEEEQAIIGKANVCRYIGIIICIIAFIIYIKGIRNDEE